MSARKSFFRSPIGRFVDTLLLVLIALALLAKICLSLNWVGALRPYTAQIHTMLFVLVGVYGLLTGLRLRHRWLGFPVGLAGLFLLVMPAIPTFRYEVWVATGAVVLILLVAVFNPRAR
ncbi:MAG: hypothetical protein ACFNYD_08470 [Bacteroides sp.]